MLDLKKIFKNHFNTKEISVENLRKFTEINLQRMSANNPGGIYDEIIANTTTAYTNYFGAITDEDTKTAIKEGSTIAMNNALSDFKQNARQKEGIVRGTYGVNSPEYQKFYPHGITEYNRCTLANCETLMEKMVSAAEAHQQDLGSVFVDLFTNLKTKFLSARTAQISLIGDVSGKREATAANKALLTVQLTKNVLAIAANNVDNMNAVNTYFDQSFLRRPKRKISSGSIAGNEILNIEERAYSATQMIYLRNKGISKLAFGLVANVNAPASAVWLSSGVRAMSEK